LRLSWPKIVPCRKSSVLSYILVDDNVAIEWLGTNHFIRRILCQAHPTDPSICVKQSLKIGHPEGGQNIASLSRKCSPTGSRRAHLSHLGPPWAGSIWQKEEPPLPWWAQLSRSSGVSAQPSTRAGWHTGERAFIRRACKGVDLYKKSLSQNLLVTPTCLHTYFHTLEQTSCKT
jgi:hypothetical protein